MVLLDADIADIDRWVGRFISIKMDFRWPI